MLARARSFTLAVFLAASPLAGAQADISAQLRALPSVKSVQFLSDGRTYDITFEQPVDHKNPAGPKFGQHVYLVHSNFNKPNVLNTEGYDVVGVRGGEPQRMFEAPNVLTVEHRYFGKSVPSPVNWKQLTVKNAADDMHRVVTTLKKLYKGKWISMGYSKGGQTALFYKCFYPNDVDATIAYVAPVNVTLEDPRIYEYFEKVGDAETRKKILDLQIALLNRRDEVLAILKPNPKDFSLGVDKAYEYGVLEFPFSMWQYGTKPAGLPRPDAPATELAEVYRKVNGMYYYSDAAIRRFGPSILQCYSELGFYNYDITDLKPYLKSNPPPNNLDLAPPAMKGKIVFNPATMAFVYNFLQYKAQNVVFVYGESDPWAATQLPLIGRTNAIKLVVKGAWHNANVKLASAEQKDLFYSTMEKWLGMPLIRA